MLQSFKSNDKPLYINELFFISKQKFIDHRTEIKNEMCQAISNRDKLLRDKSSEVDALKALVEDNPPCSSETSNSNGAHCPAKPDTVFENFLNQYSKKTELGVVRQMLKNKSNEAMKLSDTIKVLRESFCKCDLDYKKALENDAENCNLNYFLINFSRGDQKASKNI